MSNIIRIEVEYEKDKVLKELKDFVVTISKEIEIPVLDFIENISSENLKVVLLYYRLLQKFFQEKVETIENEIDINSIGEYSILDQYKLKMINLLQSLSQNEQYSKDLAIFKAHFQDNEIEKAVKDVFDFIRCNMIFVMQLKEEKDKKRFNSEDTTIEFAGSSSSQHAEECIINLEKQNMEKSRKIDELGSNLVAAQQLKIALEQLNKEKDTALEELNSKLHATENNLMSKEEQLKRLEWDIQQAQLSTLEKEQLKKQTQEQDKQIRILEQKLKEEQTHLEEEQMHITGLKIKAKEVDNLKRCLSEIVLAKEQLEKENLMSKRHISFLKQKIELDLAERKVEDLRKNEQETNRLLEIESLKSTIQNLNETVQSLEREKVYILKDLQLSKQELFQPNQQNHKKLKEEMDYLEKKGKRYRQKELDSEDGNSSFLSERVFFGSDEEGEREMNEKSQFKKIILELQEEIKNLSNANQQLKMGIKGSETIQSSKTKEPSSMLELSQQYRKLLLKDKQGEHTIKNIQEQLQTAKINYERIIAKQLAQLEVGRQESEHKGEEIQILTAVIGDITKQLLEEKGKLKISNFLNRIEAKSNQHQQQQKNINENQLNQLPQTF